nr:MAG TPA: hypothetical protein [Caudoviricetes sp.]
MPSNITRNKKPKSNYLFVEAPINHKFISRLSKLY